MMRIRRLAAGLAGLIALGLGPAVAEPVRFIAFGDMPYDWPKDLVRFSELIEAGRRRAPDQ